MRTVLEALLCVIIPLAWGVGSARILARLEDWHVGRRRGSPTDRCRQQSNEIEYHI